jgi:hypothetical protein
MPGWQPDASWPPPPDGWVYWRLVPRTRRRRVLRAVLIGVPALLVGLLVAAEVYDQATGCGSVDPTDPNNYSDVTLLNDTGGTVVVDDCSGAYCDAYNLPVRLAPGQTYDDHAACASSGTDMTSWRVKTADGKLLGYFAVDTPRKRDGLVFPVSHASHDRRTPTQPS